MYSCKPLTILVNPTEQQQQFLIVYFAQHCTLGHGRTFHPHNTFFSHKLNGCLLLLLLLCVVVSWLISFFTRSYWKKIAATPVVVVVALLLAVYEFAIFCFQISLKNFFNLKKLTLKSKYKSESFYVNLIMIFFKN